VNTTAQKKNLVPALSSACLPGKRKMTECIELCLKHGLRNIELGAGIIPDIPFADLPKKFPEAQLLIHNYFPVPQKSFLMNLASSESEIVNLTSDLIRRAIDISASIGAPFYSFHGGFVGEPSGRDEWGFIFPEPKPEDRLPALNRFAENLFPLVEEAKKTGVQLLVENNVCPPYQKDVGLFGDEKDFLWLFGQKEFDPAGILLDFGHMNVSAQSLSFDAQYMIQAIVPHIRACHIHQNDGTADQHRPIFEDFAVISPVLDYVSSLESVGDQNNPGIWLTLEGKHESQEDAFKAWKQLKNYISHYSAEKGSQPGNSKENTGL